MADQGSIANLKQNIDENIVQNTTKQISGTKMNTVLNNIVDTLNFNGRDFFNVNEYREKSDEYANAADARAAVPDEVKKLGLFITYLLADGWHLDQYKGSNISGWGTASNWQGKDITVVKNTTTGVNELKVGETIVATMPSLDNFGYTVMAAADNPVDAANKVIVKSGFVKSEQTIFAVRLYPSNTADNLTLNINNTGALPLYYNGRRADSLNCWKANELGLLISTNTEYHILSFSYDWLLNLITLQGTTENYQYNSFLRELYLTGINVNSNYYLSIIRKESNHYNIYINPEGSYGVDYSIARALSATEQSLVRITEINGSGINGWAILDWSQIKQTGWIQKYNGIKIRNINAINLNFNPRIASYLKNGEQDVEIQKVAQSVKTIDALTTSDVLMLANKIIEDKPYFLNNTFASETAEGDSSYLDEKLRDIPNGKHFIFTSDPHIDYEFDWWLQQRETEIMDYVRSRLNGSVVISGGDCIGQRGDSEHIGDLYANQAAKVLSIYNQEKCNAFGADYLWCEGNHDANATDGYNLIPSSEIYKRTTGLMARYKKVVFDEEGIELINNLSATDEQKAEMIAWWKQHYYYDDGKNKIRFIVLESGDGSDGLRTFLNNSWDGYTAMVTYNTFVGNALQSCPDGWDVVVVVHQIALVSSIKDGVMSFSRKGYYNIYGLLSAFKNKTSFTVTGDGSVSSSTFAYSLMESRIGSGVTFNFSNRTSGRCFMLSGHFHFDDAWVIQNADTSSVWNYRGKEYGQWDTVLNNAILHIQIDRACLVGQGTINANWPNAVSYPNNGTGEGEEIRLGTKNEVLFDIVTITEDNKVVCTRIGGGNDRQFDLP